MNKQFAIEMKYFNYAIGDIMISKYEEDKLKEIIHRIDPKAFVVLNEGNRVVGNFEKRL